MANYREYCLAGASHRADVPASVTMSTSRGLCRDEVGAKEEAENVSKQDKATAERSDIHEPVVRRDPSDAWTAKFLKRFDRALRRKDDLSEKEKEKLQKIDEEEHNEEAHEE